MKINNKGFVPNSTILFVIMRVKIMEFKEFICSREMCFYAVYQDLTDEILQIHCRNKSREIPLAAVASAEIIKPENLVDGVNETCYYGHISLGKRASSHLQVMDGQGRFGSQKMEFFKPGEKIPK